MPSSIVCLEVRRFDVEVLEPVLEAEVEVEALLRFEIEIAIW